MESSSDYSDNSSSELDELKSNIEQLDKFVEYVDYFKKVVASNYELYQYRIDNYKKEIKDLKKKLEKREKEEIISKTVVPGPDGNPITITKFRVNVPIEIKYPPYSSDDDLDEDNEEEETDVPLYQLSAIVAYTMDRAYYNKCHNDAKAVIDDQIMKKFTIYKIGKPPIYISIEDKTLKFGRYDISNTMKRAAEVMRNFKKSAKLVHKHTFNILKAYAEELQKDDYDEKKLEMFNHMFEN